MENVHKKWSSAWNASKKPKKQRKYRSNAPLHVKHKMISCHLSPELRKKHGIRAIPLRKGDKVKILVGNSRGKTGKIDEVDLKSLKVSIAGIEITKKDGSKVKPYIDPSNLMIIELDLGDKKRDKKMKRKNRKEE
ncbi:50S ribosomal protein L24 [Candidatus Woesearchaeota archaeon CG10_big_fil_rev_8_21_14_0_10_44_13]|nr:MAG: 50S ribosomal protein L24 [Candidatus Woesearchaeota archaeon CG10_big_fil_rev_8_21_14_0_10_44_13]